MHRPAKAKKPGRRKGAARPIGWRGYFKEAGPGFITGASDDDPSGIATYAQAGAQFRYGLLWTSLFTFPLMAAVQEICDRTALATGTSLGALADKKFPRARVWLAGLTSMLIAANVFNISADISAVGEGVHLLHAGPATLWAPIAAGTVTCLLVAGSFERVTAVCKFLCLALLAYVVVLL